MDEQAFRARLAETAAAVERALDGLLALEPKAGESGPPAAPDRSDALRDAWRRQEAQAFSRRSKRRARSARRRSAPVLAGAAVECVHAYSLIHDDLPAMDDDDLGAAGRRPTAPSTRRPPSWRATPCRRWPSRSLPIREPTQRRDPRRRSAPASPAPRASPAWSAARCSTSRRKPRPAALDRRRSSVCRR